MTYEKKFNIFRNYLYSEIPKRKPVFPRGLANFERNPGVG